MPALFLQRYALQRQLLLAPGYVAVWHASDACKPDPSHSPGRENTDVALIFLADKPSFDAYSNEFIKSSKNKSPRASSAAVVRWYESVTPDVMFLLDGSLQRVKQATDAPSVNTPFLRKGHFFPTAGAQPDYACDGRGFQFCVVVSLPAVEPQPDKPEHFNTFLSPAFTASIFARTADDKDLPEAASSSKSSTRRRRRKKKAASSSHVEAPASSAEAAPARGSFDPQSNKALPRVDGPHGDPAPQLDHGLSLSLDNLKEHLQSSENVMDAPADRGAPPIPGASDESFHNQPEARKRLMKLERIIEAQQRQIQRLQDQVGVADGDS